MSEPKPPVAGEIAGAPRRKRSTVVQLVLLAAAIGGLAWAALALRDSTPTRSAVRALLSASDPADRRAAARELGSPTDIEMPRAIPALARATSDADPEVRAEAVRALGVLGSQSIKLAYRPGTDHARDALVAAFKDKDPAVRQTALTMIMLMSDAAASASGDENDRSPLGDISGVAARIGEALGDPEPSVRVAASRALAAFPKDIDPAIPALVKAAAAEVPAKGRGGIAGMLRNLRPSKGAVPPLVESLRSADPKVRSYSATLLGRAGAEAAEAIPALIEALKEPAPPEGSQDPAPAAATALGAIAPSSPRAAEAIAALKDFQKSDNPARARAAEAALARIGEKSP